VSENHAGGGGGAAADHVLIGAADICRDDPQDDGVVDLFAGGILHFGEVDGLDFYFILSEKNYSSVFSHFFIATSLRVTVKRSFPGLEILSLVPLMLGSRKGSAIVALPFFDSFFEII
jgi:hypothetical protein